MWLSKCFIYSLFKCCSYVVLMFKSKEQHKNNIGTSLEQTGFEAVWDLFCSMVQ